eukprot:355280-Chlamydomonas_euryale.AAC.6
MRAKHWGGWVEAGCEDAEGLGERYVHSKGSALTCGHGANSSTFDWAGVTKLDCTLMLCRTLCLREVVVCGGSGGSGRHRQLHQYPLSELPTMCLQHCARRGFGACYASATIWRWFPSPTSSISAPAVGTKHHAHLRRTCATFPVAQARQQGGGGGAPDVTTASGAQREKCVGCVGGCGWDWEGGEAVPD